MPSERSLTTRGTPDSKGECHSPLPTGDRCQREMPGSKGECHMPSLGRLRLSCRDSETPLPQNNEIRVIAKFKYSSNFKQLNPQPSKLKTQNSKLKTQFRLSDSSRIALRVGFKEFLKIGWKTPVGTPDGGSASTAYSSST